jgi:hypothetical protein
MQLLPAGCLLYEDTEHGQRQMLLMGCDRESGIFF